jgi:hypothetical protein
MEMLLMSKVVIKNVDGVETAVATVDFDLGKVYREKVSEDGNVRSIVSGFGVEGTFKFYKQLMYEKAEKSDWEGFNECLEQYNTFLLLKTIGVETSPLQFNEEGELEGLNKEVEVEINL